MKVRNRKGVYVIIGLLLVILGVAVPGGFVARGEEGIAVKPLIAVFTLEDLRASDDTKGLGEDIAASITDGLAKVESVKVVERKELKKILDEIGLTMTGAVDETTALRVGKLLGANRLALGSFMKFGDKVRINVRLIKTETGEVLCTARVTGSFDNIFELEEDLVKQMVATGLK